MNDRAMHKLIKEVRIESHSIFPKDDYLDSENLWQKIMDIRNGQRDRFNLKTSHRIVRAASGYYAAIDHVNQLFITDYK